MGTKKWTCILLALVIGTLIVFSAVMFTLDPVLNFGPEKKITSYYEYSTLYTNPGIAKHYEYDTVLVGTSMIQNTDVDVCDELLDCKMVRLPYSGGTTYDMATILDMCFQSQNEIKTVYWELDQFQLTGSSTEHRYPVPEYLYNYDITDDISYLLNLDVMYHYGMNNILGTLRGQETKAERRGITFDGDYSKEAVLNSYSRPEKNSKVLSFDESMINKVDGNLSNITSLVKANQDTEFVFFLPPFSVLYWDREVQTGSFDAMLDATLYALKNLLPYENVKIYYYQAEKEIISNLDNYKDYSHYGNWINDLITQHIAEGKNKVTEENCDEHIQQLKEYISSYDFEKLLIE